jgi:hypothetical protein
MEAPSKTGSNGRMQRAAAVSTPAANANAISTMSNFLARADRRRHFTSVSNGLPFSTM